MGGIISAVRAWSGTRPSSSAQWEISDRVLELTTCGVTALLAVFVSRPGRRTRIQGWLALRGKDIGAAAAVAALMSGYSAGAVEKEARDCFHYILWGRVTYEVMVNDAQTLDGNAAVDRTLYSNLSQKALAGEVDAFISHSWHDDAADKWEKLESWCQLFERRFHAEPKLWIDKYCINQNDLTSSLRSLPVFLAGCKRLVILWGPTYSTRLWCVLEVFVYRMMQGSASNITVIPTDGMTFETIHAQLESLSMQHIKAFSERDLDRLLGVMEAAAGEDPAPLLRSMLLESIELHRSNSL